MRCDSDSDDSFSPSSEQEQAWPAPRPQRPQQTSLQQLISLNVTIFNDLGFTVSPDSFSHAPHPLEEEEPNNDSESERSEIDYGDSEDEVVLEEEGEFVFEEENGLQQESGHSHWTHRWQWPQDEQDDSNESPFFPEAARPEGLSVEEITRIPTMQWSFTHNLFNRGQKCAVCLQDFQLGNALRVMECLHRYHLDCLDQWLTLRATCPSCRSPPRRAHPPL